MGPRSIVLVAAASGASGRHLAALLGELRTAGHEVAVLSRHAGPLEATGGVRAHATGTLLELPARPWLVMVAGGRGARNELLPAAHLGEALRRARRAGALLASVGEGTLVLARAGLLTGFLVAADAELADELAELGVIVEATPLLIDRRVITARDAAAHELARELLVQLGPALLPHAPV